MARQRTIAVVTGARAELGLLAPVMRAIAAQRGLRLRVVAAGLHMVQGTWRSIERDWRLRIDAKVPMQRRGETGRTADVAAVGRGVTGFGQAFNTLKVDVVLVLGDRIEAFAAATAASIGGMRVAHIHGGDRAEGVADEAMRHAITKLAHLHYPATAQSRARLLRMGETAEQVVRAGSPAVDGLLLAERKRPREPRHVVVMQHPVGSPAAQERQWMRQTLAAAADFAKGQGAEVLIFEPNGDPGSDGIVRAIDETCGDATSGRWRSDVTWQRHAYVPRGRFLAMLRQSWMIVGNSSAGLIEAAVLRVPCVNVGPRQGGRERGGNVVDCDYGRQNTLAAMHKAAGLDLRRLRHPYGSGDAATRIAEHLAAVNLADVPVRKRNAY